MQGRERHDQGVPAWGEHSTAAYGESTHESLATLGPAVSHDSTFTRFHYGLLSGL